MTNNATTNPSPEIKKSTTSKVASRAHDAIDDAASRAEPVEHKLRDRAGKAQERLDASQEQARQQVQQTIESLEDFIKRRPATAAAIAFAAGVVTTALLRR